MKRTVKERYLLLKNRQAKDWWTATFGDPFSWFILALVGDIKWITPDLITIVSFFAKLIPALLLVRWGHEYIITAAILLQIGQILDSMDGNLARYRQKPTESGGFLDRILDGLGYMIVMTCLSWYTYIYTPAPAYYLLLGPAAAGFYLMISYMYWHVVYIRQKHTKTSQAEDVEDNIFDISGVPLWLYIFRSQHKIFNVNQADFYFWIGLFLVAGRPDICLWFLFITNGLKMIDRFFGRLRQVRKVDKGLVE